ncbi:protein rolling stone-like isoform X2 [Gigantopelta aegis]|uniref:protein rolling stone-like isoform X2 n=1 Tax=Gigantopelta aegis TaxID=1735272 RepID=UPI001B88C1A0|nr:protein rolling stone-like isoform X2 [Gigantopelta aegis]
MACILGHLPFDWHYRMCNTAKSRKWFIYLTNWSYFCLTLDALLEFIAVVFVRRTRPDILSAGEHITITTLIEHALNGVYVILNLPVTAVPFKIYHMYQTMIFGVVYITFTIVYQALGGTNRHDKPYIYPQIDWNHPGTAAMFSAGSTFVAIPLIHSLLYLLCLARTAVYKRYQTRPEASMV